MLCEYGCGQESTHQFKSGKWCCSKTVSSCIGMKQKNSSGVKKIRAERGDSYWVNGHPKPQLGKESWNKGKTTPDHIKEKISKALIGVSTGKGSTIEKEIERKRKITEKAKKNNGGYREGSGRGKKGRYKGFWCDSSWELAWVMYHLDHGIVFERNWTKFPYQWEGKTKNYIPDFKINDHYIEIKGYNTLQADAKIAAFPFEIVVLNEVDMKPFIQYAIQTYGKNFTELYEKRA